MTSKSTIRPTTIDEMFDHLKRLGTDESTQNGLAFQPEETDVFISPYAKSGTTWLQQIVHGLRTRGSMEFDEITSVVPWLERAQDLGIDLNNAQSGTPRAFKSHASWDIIPKGGKYICSVRNPNDVLVSFYHFFESWWFEKGTISMEDFAREFFIGRDPERTYWYHLASWWEQRHNPDVLLLSFEGMKQNPQKIIRTVADFTGIELDDELFKIVLYQSSLDFMKANKEKFNDHLMRTLSETQSGLPPGGDASKVREGRVGDYKQELSQEIIDELDAIWEKEIRERFGLVSYQALRDELTFE